MPKPTSPPNSNKSKRRRRRRAPVSSGPLAGISLPDDTTKVLGMAKKAIEAALEYDEEDENPKKQENGRLKKNHVSVNIRAWLEDVVSSALSGEKGVKGITIGEAVKSAVHNGRIKVAVWVPLEHVGGKEI